MANRGTDTKKIGKKTIFVNILIILAVAFIGIWIAYLSTAIFTKHGESATVPAVENMTYTRAVELLHSKGFNVDIRDSLFRTDIKPGFVIEQFPKANSIVKPGRKIFLYINAVHPKEVVIDDSGDKASLALKDWSFRQVKSRLMELGFKNVGKVTVLGADDRVVKLTANGKPIFKMQKIPVNARIIIEVSDGRLGMLRDSLYADEMRKLGIFKDNLDNYYDESAYKGSYGGGSVSSGGSSGESETVEEVEFLEIPDEEPASTE